MAAAVDVVDETADDIADIADVAEVDTKINPEFAASDTAFIFSLRSIADIFARTFDLIWFDDPTVQAHGPE